MELTTDLQRAAVCLENMMSAGRKRAEMVEFCLLNMELADVEKTKAPEDAMLLGVKTEEEIDGTFRQIPFVAVVNREDARRYSEALSSRDYQF